MAARKAATPKTKAAASKKAKAAAPRKPRKPTPAKSAAKKPKPAPRKPPKARVRVNVISVFGAFNSRALIEMPAGAAEELIGEPLAKSGRTTVIEGAEREVSAIRKRDPELAKSALAASAVALAYEIEHPYNSATSKSNCAKEMRDTLDRLRELAPEEEKEDDLDDLGKRRAARLARPSG